MAIGLYRFAGVRLPHPPIPVHLLLVVEQALAEAWKRLNDETQFLAVCAFCHMDIHANPENARNRGLLK